MAVALQMLRRMHRRLTSAKPFLWDPTRAVPAARLARPCWHDLRVVFTARPWPWATTTHKADTHKLNTMHRLELLDQEFARTWDKTLPCRLRRSSAARLSHGTDFRAGVATHNFHMADRHQWHTMCLPLRCWAKGRHSWHIVSPHCDVDKTISAGVLHGWLVFRGVARRNLHCMVDMHMWHTMCLPLRSSARGCHSSHIFPYCYGCGKAGERRSGHCFALCAERCSGCGCAGRRLHSGAGHGRLFAIGCW